jgi:peptidylprolyl isomerase
LGSDGSKFDSSVDRGKPFKFTIGQGMVISGWEEGFASMKVGECATLKVRSDYGYGDRGSPPKIPAKAELLFDVQLLSFAEKQKERYQMSAEEKLAHADKLKAAGTEMFQKQNYMEAAAKYEDGANFAVEEGVTGNDIPEQERPLYVSCWSNAAMCYVKLKEWSDATRACNHVLDIDSETKNIKALYRRGFSRMKLGLYKEAKTDLMDVYKIDNANKDVRKALAQLKEEIANSKKKEKAAFGGLFNKVDFYNDKQGVLVPNSKGDNPHVYFQIKHGEEDLGR